MTQIKELIEKGLSIFNILSFQLHEMLENEKTA